MNHLDGRGTAPYTQGMHEQIQVTIQYTPMGRAYVEWINRPDYDPNHPLQEMAAFSAGWHAAMDALLEHPERLDDE